MPVLLLVNAMGSTLVLLLVFVVLCRVFRILNRDRLIEKARLSLGSRLYHQHLLMVDSLPLNDNDESIEQEWILNPKVRAEFSAIGFIEDNGDSNPDTGDASHW